MDYIDKIENGELFVRCLHTVEDCDGVYMIEGKKYEVVDEDDDRWIIQCEDIDGLLCEMAIKKDDKDIELIE